MRAASRSIGSLLSSVPGLKAISVQLDRLAAMQRICATALPKSLSDLVRVAAFDGETVLIQSDSSASAAKIKHLAPRLLRALKNHFPDVARVRVETTVLHRSTLARGPARRMGATPSQAWAALAGSLPAGSLRSAIVRLLAGQTELDREHDALERQKGEADGRDE
jgi:hypothetical protein